MADNSTKLLVGVIVLLAIVGVVFLMKSGGYHYKTEAEMESPYGWTGECCTCSRAQLTLHGAVRPESREVLFRNEHVVDCSAACADYHMRTKNPRAKYEVSSFVSNDKECRTSLPSALTYGGAGGFTDQPTSDVYYRTS